MIIFNFAYWRTSLPEYGLAEIFSHFIRFFTGFFENLWKHYGNSYPTDALKTGLALQKIISAASYRPLHISYYGRMLTSTLQVMFPGTRIEDCATETLAM